MPRLNAKPSFYQKSRTIDEALSFFSERSQQPLDPCGIFLHILQQTEDTRMCSFLKGLMRRKRSRRSSFAQGRTGKVTNDAKGYGEVV